uniref:Ig-like domain-containing protein n=1 Tax=Erpetoichthys calabaricus TaxID=27687 RepID=A0A8C4RJG6_ERPCA
MCSMDFIFMCWIPLLCFTGWSEEVQVTALDKKKISMLFQSVTLRCKFSTSSTQPPVVQWWYKSFCQDRTLDAFSFSDSNKISEPSSLPSLECPDTSRTVRPVASRQGLGVTLGEYYKGRDITITNNADLQIGELQWGDSGVYYCKVVVPDDLMGQNEDKMELLVLGELQ